MRWSFHEGAVQFVGDPEDASLRYYRLNFAGPPAPDSEGVNPPGDYVGTVDLNARLVSARLMDENGDSVENVEQRKPISIDVVVEIARELANPTFAFHVLNADGMIVLAELSAGCSTNSYCPDSGFACGDGSRTHSYRGATPWTVGSAGRSRRAIWACSRCGCCTSTCSARRPRHGVVSLQSDIEPTLEP